jgi:transcriptional regulator with XRE-family HTH domain
MLSGKELKIKRIVLDIKANELAEMLGVSKSYISLMENNRRKIPLHIYERWIEILGLKNKIN